MRHSDIVVTAQGRREALSGRSDRGQRGHRRDTAEFRRNRHPPAQPARPVAAGFVDRHPKPNGSARIRGIGTVGDNPGLESSVAVFIDGVYRSRSGIGLNELGEIDRIEVLRGPQGTLFGRNTSAGLIRSSPPSRTFNDSEVYGELTSAIMTCAGSQVGVTGRLSDTIAARLDGVYVKRDGFYDDVISGPTRRQRPRPLSSRAANCCSNRATICRSA